MARALPMLCCLMLVSAGCETRNDQSPVHEPGADDAGMPDAAARDDAGSAFGGLSPNTDADAHVVDLFAEPGHRFWLEVSATELARINGVSNGGLIPLAAQQAEDQKVGFGVGGDIYDPSGEPTFVDHMLVQDAKTKLVADYGKIQVRLVGNETYRSWDAAHIPNFRIDADQFSEGMRIGSFEHIRLNNSLTGTIFRERMAHEIFRAVGYPALRTSYAWVGSNVWGKDVWVPMTLIEVYKRRFCVDNEKLLGGTCQNMWEFGQDVASGVPVDGCQVSSCDDSVLEELGARLRGVPKQAGFMKKIEDLVDWPRFHEYQCLSWILGFPDDPIHAGNNNLIIERQSDHKLIWEPYSVDISQSHGWSDGVGLAGNTPLTQGCQSDPECWKNTLATCEDMIAKFKAIAPEKMLDENVALLESLGMMRSGDVERAAELRAWYVERKAELSKELDYFRNVPNAWGVCPDGLERCEDGGCGTETVCASRGCSAEKPWCPSRRACVSTEFDECPKCTKANPFHCSVTDTCVADELACTAECAAKHDETYTYCSLFASCIPPETSCYDGGGGGFPID